MGTIILCIAAYAILFLVIKLAIAASEKMDKKREQIAFRERTLDLQIETIKSWEREIENQLKNFFSNWESYTDVYASLDGHKNSHQRYIENISKTNRNLPYRRRIEQEKQIKQLETHMIKQEAYFRKGLNILEQRVSSLPASKMMREMEYGKNNREYWDAVQALDRTSMVSYIDNCTMALDDGRWDVVFSIDVEKVLQCIWFFATEKTFSVSDFQKARAVFSRVNKSFYADVLIAEYYAKKKMAGEDILRDAIRDLLKQKPNVQEPNSQELLLIASGLMWMNAYQSENMILQHMLASGKEMPVKAQERLHALTNGGGKAPSGFDVSSSKQAIYFDVSALAWKEEEYVGLFENLAFQDKVLTYSLALREENKDLFLAQGLRVPERYDIVRKFLETFTEEYGSMVSVQEANAVALSGSGEERMDGILVSSAECRQMGILIYIARIGKKLIIKFYTLFMPLQQDLAAQKQQALSMYKKLSPSVTMWESSLKDTMLMAVEQMLNTEASRGTIEKETISNMGQENFGGPIF